MSTSIPGATEYRGQGVSGAVSMIKRLGRLLPLIAALGTLVIFVITLARGARLERQTRGGRPAPDALEERIATLSRRLGIARPPAASLVEACIPPMVWAPWPTRPHLVLPQALLARLDNDETDALLLHELTHIARRDHVVRLVEMVATILYWWHPVLWVARRALRRNEERACDVRTVTTRPDLASAYARGLLATLDFLRRGGAERPALATASDPRNDLEERLTMILHPTPSSFGTLRLHRYLRRGLIALGAAALLVVPVQAGSDEPEREALIAGMQQLEDQARAVREQQKALEAQLEALEEQRRALAQEAESRKLEAYALKLEGEQRGDEAETVRNRVELLRRQRLIEADHRALERQARVDVQQLEAALAEEKKAFQALEGSDSARAAEVRARAEALAVERDSRLSEARAQARALEISHQEVLREHLERAEVLARDAGNQERLERISRERQAFERKAMHRAEEREVEERERMLEREAREQKRAYDRLQGEGRLEDAMHMRRELETEKTLQQAKIEYERALKQRKSADITLEKRLRGLEHKLESLSERASGTEREALERQLQALRNELERFASDG